MTFANDVPSDLPRFFQAFRSADSKADPLARSVPRPADLGDRCKDGDDTTSDFVWALAYWPWL